MRIIAQGLAVISLAGLFLKPSVQIKSSPAVLLLTKNFDARKADSIRNIHDLKILRLPGTASFADAPELPSYNSIGRYRDDILFILGDGLPEFTAHLIKSDFKYINGKTPYGVVQLSLPDNVVKNRASALAGMFRTGEDSVRLYLTGPGGKEDSVLLPPHKTAPFLLRFFPKESGEFVYSVVAGASDPSTFPVVVREPRQMKILFIQHHPNFETRYLKTFLARYHQVVLRQKLSRDIYHFEFLNTRKAPFKTMNTELLSDFDLLIIDSDALSGLAAIEMKSIQNAVGAGLGTLILFNEDPSAVRRLPDLLPVKFNKIQKDTASISVDGKMISVSTVSSAPVASATLHPVVNNPERMLAAYVHNGTGRVGFTLAHNTYGLYLQGDSISYGQLWSKITEPVARRDNRKYDVRILNRFPLYADEPVSVQITGSDEPPALTLDGVEIPVIEDQSIDGVWNADIWTDTTGWHRLFVRNDSTAVPFYISQKNEWTELSRMNMSMSTSGIRNKSTAGEIEQRTFKAVPPLYFYLLLLVSFGFTWLVPKL